MLKKIKPFILLPFLFLVACNKNLTDEERKALWDKAQTTGEIINRSGSPFNSATNKQLALRDAETRLSTGGGLFGNDGLNVFGITNKNEGLCRNYVQNISIFSWLHARRFFFSLK